MRAYIILLVLLVSPAAQADWEPQLPPFPQDLHLDPEVIMDLAEVGGVEFITLPVPYVSTLRARTEWSRRQWLVEIKLRIDVTGSLERTHAKVAAAIREGYDARIVNFRGHIDDLETKALQDEATIYELRNPPWYRSKGFFYGLGIATAVVLGGVGALAL
jgi:hypothetical protein